MLAEGKSPTEIKQYFVDYYGARVLSEPPRTGFNWLIYVVPPVAILAGVVLLFWAFRNWQQLALKLPTNPRSNLDHLPERSRAKPAKGSTTADDKYVARLEEELRKRK
jgi:cytochrome c-type biogenesis protein CcmH/NrfF